MTKRFNSFALFIISIFVLLELSEKISGFGSDAEKPSESRFNSSEPHHRSAQIRKRRHNQESDKAVLLDTTEQSALGWTKYPDGGPATRTPGWSEESFTNFERGINWRSFVVCDVAFNSVNNWLWTPFIERGEAKRLHIEIKFTMRDCNLFPQMVLSCKETFALLYKELDAPLPAHLQPGSPGAANASFSQSDSYTLIDAIAADEGRFTSNTDVVINTEIRSIPVSKRGVYFAFRDQGACLSLISIKVYHTFCPELSTNLAQFNATPTGRDLTSLVAVEGSCVENSLQIEQPKMFCTADGNWNSMSAGQCKCLPGFQPANNHTTCQPCPSGTFKSSLGDFACQPCPAHSSAPANSLAATECKCHEGFHRASKDSRASACTQAPAAPSNLSATYVDSSTVILQWSAPENTGQRDDLTYRLLCDQCEPQTVSSPQQLNNFSETKSVLSGLQPASSYRFQVYVMNGVSQLAGPQSLQYAEISVQTARPVQQTTSNTLSTQGGFQLLPIFNFRALPGAKGSDMLLAWDLQSFQADQLDSASSDAIQAQIPALFEVRYQPRYLLEPPLRRSYHPSLVVEQQPQHQPQSVSSASRAVLVSQLSPRTEYAFQVRLKWAHSMQWSDFSEPIYASTGAQIGPPEYLSEQQSPRFVSQPPQEQPQVVGSSSWLGSISLLLLCALISLAFISVTLIHYRKSISMRSFGANFAGALGTPSTGGSIYGGVYGHGPSSDLMGGALGFGTVQPLHSHHQATMSASSAGGLITGSNRTSRSSSGAGNVVQNFIAATLGQIGSSGNHQTSNQLKQSHQHTIGAGSGGKLFAAGANQLNQPQLQRNLYHQTLSNVSHTMLLANQTNQLEHQQLHSSIGGGNINTQCADAFKYRTLKQQQQQAGAGQQQQQQYQDPQLHIYDDLDTSCTGLISQQQQQLQSSSCRTELEVEPQQVRIESIIGKGEFGDVCLGWLSSSSSSKDNNKASSEFRVAVKTLKPQASHKAKLDFLTEASIMSRLEHPNIIRLEAMVTNSEPFMIVSEYMENGSLDLYLRENKSKLGQLQLISMLRGIALGMQYLAKLNYVHKDLAARNILVDSRLVCKISDFGLSAHQSASQEVNLEQYTSPMESSTASTSSNTLSSQSNQTCSSLASSGNQQQQLRELQLAAQQMVQQRFASQQPQLASNCQPVQLLHSIQNPRIPVRWTALEAIAFRRFTSASDVWSFGIVCWEVMSGGERPYWNWSNQDVIKALEQGYRLPQPEGCPDQLYKLMLDCWLKERAARPTFAQIVKQLEQLLSPYDDPFSELVVSANQQQQRQQQLEPTYFDSYNPIRQLMSSNQKNINGSHNLEHPQQSVDEWLSSIKMSRYIENFQRHQINSLQYVARLSQPDLNLIGISNNQHLKKILTSIASLRTAASIGASGEGFLV